MAHVIVPWFGGCPHREAALRWLLPKYKWPVTVAPGPDPWVKALAAGPAIAASTADVVIVADADVWCDGLVEAVKAVENGAPWAIPHSGVHRLDEAGTLAVMDGADWQEQRTCQRPYRGYPGGGYVVARRTTLIDIPLDPRFTGWGHEDSSWAAALNTLAGHYWRGTEPLIHLWHPPQNRISRRRGSVASDELGKRYEHARGKPLEMRALIEEAKRDCHGPNDAHLHDHAAI